MLTVGEAAPQSDSSELMLSHTQAAGLTPPPAALRGHPGQRAWGAEQGKSVAGGRSHRARCQPASGGTYEYLGRAVAGQRDDILTRENSSGRYPALTKGILRHIA